jgi:CP family cyanate transporter-like MFS transporter
VAAADDAAGLRSVSAPLIGLFIAALSLRPQLVGAAPLIPQIQADLGLSHAQAGLIGTIPVLCMGLLAVLAPIAASRMSLFAAVALSLVITGAFGVVRSAAPDGLTLVLLTFGVGAGMALGGAIVPLYVREHVPRNLVAGSVAYSSGLQLGAALSAAVAVPLAAALAGWRSSLAVFSVVTLVLVIPWSQLGRRQVAAQSTRLHLSRRLMTDRRGWLLGLVFGLFGIVYYGLISWIADVYRERGWTPEAAGLVIATINVASLVGALIAGLLTRRLGMRTALMLLAVGFGVAPAAFVVLPDFGFAWAALAGLTNGALFPLLLALPLPIGRSTEEVVGMSTVMIGVGYTLAATSPIVLGAVRDATGSFNASLLVVTVIGIAFAAGVAFLSLWLRSQPQNAPA